MAKRSSANSTTIRNPERARALGRAGRAKQLAAQEAARGAARQAALTPSATPPSSPHLSASAAVSAAQASALAGFFELLPLAVGLRIHRLRPVWAAGYLEDTDKMQIQQYGGIHAYLADVWGGEAFRVELVDELQRPLGPGWTIPIRRPVLNRGQLEMAPEPARYQAPPVLPPREPVPVAVPVAAPQPAPAAHLTAPQSAALVDLVTQLGQTNQRLLGELERMTAAGSNGGSHPAPDIGEVFQSARKTLAEAQAFARAVNGARGGRERDERDERPERPGFVRTIIDGLGSEIGRSLIHDFRSSRGEPDQAPQRRQATATQPDAGAGDFVDAEVGE